MPLSRPAPAKINLGLHVLRTRGDGYHDVETVYHRVGWEDTVSVEAADGLSMTCSDSDLPTGDDNLCLQAARRLASAFEVDRGAAIHLEKTLPVGAGLGGGSSDAAATLRLLTDLWGIEAGNDTLIDLAAQIGSDVPFFLWDDPAAYATGRGEKLEPIRDADGAPFRLDATIVLVVPPVGMATPEAYAMVTPDDVNRADLKPLVASGDLGRWRSELVNDFTEPIAERYPSVDAARDLLHEHGADYVSLSGSGSTVYGLFTSARQADAARQTADREGYRTWMGTP
jgi:4-diphosphocytidyl-2-C-methyl-D-erythritol kinase